MRIIQPTTLRNSFSYWQTDTPANTTAGSSWMRNSDYVPFIADGSRWLSWAVYRIDFGIAGTVSATSWTLVNQITANVNWKGYIFPFSSRVVSIQIMSVSAPNANHSVGLRAGSAAGDFATVNWNGTDTYATDTTGYTVDPNTAIRARVVIGAGTPNPENVSCHIHVREIG